MTLLTACDQQAWFDRMAPKDEVAFAKAVVGQLAASDIAAVQERLSPELQKEADLGAKLQEVVRQFPAGTPSDARLVGSEQFKSDQLSRYSLTFEYAYPDQQWLLAEVNLEQHANGPLQVVRIQVLQPGDSLENINRFKLAGKSPVHYFFFAMCIATPLFILATLVLCIRTPMRRRKWLWMIFVLLGFAQFSIDWTTGEIGASALAVQVLGAGFIKTGPVAPWTLYFGLPVGAVVFLALRWRGFFAAKPAALEEAFAAS